MPEPRPPVPSSWPLYRCLVGAGLACAVVVVTVHQVTRPAIEANRAQRLRAAIVEVVPGTAEARSFRRSARGALEPLSGLEGGEGVVHAGFDAGGNLLGFAFEGRGAGYQSTIELLLGYDPVGERTMGVAVLASRETPGLGDRIRSRRFTGAFAGLDARLDRSGAALLQALEIARPGTATEPWQLDGITGATVSSRAMARIASEALTRWAPLLRSDQAIRLRAER